MQRAEARCSHCERLNLDCTWNRTPISRNISSTYSQARQFNYEPVAPNAIGAFGFSPYTGGFNFTWDEAMLLSPSSWTDYSMTAPPLHELPPQSPGGTWSPPILDNITSNNPNNVLSNDGGSMEKERPTISSLRAHRSSEERPNAMDQEYLLNEFLRVFFPPILAPVEIGPKWPTTRSFFASLCSESTMVKLAVMAFSAFQLSISQNGTQIDHKSLYESAYHEIYSESHEGGEDAAKSKDLKHILAALFLLTYVDVSRSKEWLATARIN